MKSGNFSVTLSPMETQGTLHQFKVPGLLEGEIDFADFAGKKVLIVNTASECGYTPQYAQLRELQDNFREVLVVIGVPCNDFGGQEPDDNKVIASFCERIYKCNFPMTTKLNIMPPNTHPLYQWLTKESLNGVQDAEVRWNFHKFLVDENGILITDFPTAMSPIDEAIINLL